MTFTADWLPPASRIRTVLGPDRAKVIDRFGGDPVIEEEIAARGGSLAAELTAELPTRLSAVAENYVVYAVCALLEARFFPEQANVPDSNRDYYDDLAGAELARLRNDDSASGDEDVPFSGTISATAGRSRCGPRGVPFFPPV